MTAFVHVGVRRPSHSRLKTAADMEQQLIKMIRELAPDMDEGEQAPLNLRIAAQGLKDAGSPMPGPEHVTRTLEGIAETAAASAAAAASWCASTRRDRDGPLKRSWTH